MRWIGGAEEKRQPPGLFSFDFVFLLIATVIILFVVNNLDHLDPARPVSSLTRLSCP